MGYLQRSGEYPVQQVEAAQNHIMESKHMAEFFHKLGSLCDDYGVDYDMLLTYMENNPNKVMK